MDETELRKLLDSWKHEKAELEKMLRYPNANGVAGVQGVRLSGVIDTYGICIRALQEKLPQQSESTRAAS